MNYRVSVNSVISNRSWIFSEVNIKKPKTRKFDSKFITSFDSFEYPILPFLIYFTN